MTASQRITTMPPEIAFTPPRPHYDADAALVELAVKEGRLRQREVEYRRQLIGGIWDPILKRFVPMEDRQ